MGVVQRNRKSTGGSVFIVDMGEGKKMVMEASVPYGTFIATGRKAKDYNDLNQLIGSDGLTMGAVRPLMNYLGLSTDRAAALMGVSSRTIARWDDASTIGVLASKTLLELDRLTKKGIDVFGNAELFKSWLQQSNVALGDVAPIQLLTEPYGLELIEDALEALEYGSVM